MQLVDDMGFDWLILACQGVPRRDECKVTIFTDVDAIGSGAERGGAGLFLPFAVDRFTLL